MVEDIKNIKDIECFFQNLNLEEEKNKYKKMFGEEYSDETFLKLMKELEERAALEIQ